MEMSPDVVVALLENLAIAYMSLAVIVGITGFIVGKLRSTSKLNVSAEIEQLHLCAAILFVIQAIAMLVIKVTLFGA